LQSSTSSFVRSVQGKEASMTSGTRSVCTTPPSTCEGGVGVGATTFDVMIPMPPLRQY
jgi:hypothetical protein